MKKIVVHPNEKYNDWTILEDLGMDEHNNHKVLCKCKCGKIYERCVYDIIKGHSKSCGKCNVVKIKIGDKFGKWTIISDSFVEKGKKYYWCQCECGTVKKVYHDKLVNKKSTSCGCGRIVLKDQKDKKLYNVRRHMIDRCYNPNVERYKSYGARGITVCEEWLNSTNGLDNFIEWSYKNGYNNDASYGECTLDRIDVDGNYEPSNCRWVNLDVQANNKRNTIRLAYNNEIHTITEWAKILGIERDTIDARYRKHLPIEEILCPISLKEYRKE